MLHRRLISRLRRLRGFLIVVLILTAVRSAVADWNDVPSGSMRPTILEGDRIFVNKLAYDLKIPFTTMHLAKWADPQRNDIIIFYSPEDGTRLVKRVIGLPGDLVELRNERLWINNQPASYAPLASNVTASIPLEQQIGNDFAWESFSPLIKHPVMSTPHLPAMRSFGPISVPADHYLFLGDNRDNSKDSRYIGCVARDQIVGRAVGVALSVDPDHHYLPRWARWGMGFNH
ncbi:MAG TPA: signal peptidase I [Tepidisphaeraceae bacterium]|jgi:signal peptidase I|nr:signal peptidase I [Tepidisphaeraceae bacterium]